MSQSIDLAAANGAVQSSMPAVAWRWIVLLAATQIWTLQVGLLSVAIAGFVALSLPWLRVSQIPAVALAGSLIALLSAWTAPLPPIHFEGFHYSRAFSLATLAIFMCWLTWVHQLRSDAILRIPAIAYLLLLAGALITMLLMNPELPQGLAMDGKVGLFNEKGIAAYYLASVACVWVSVRPGGWSVLVFCVIALFTLLVLESGRALLFYGAFFLLLLRTFRGAAAWMAVAGAILAGLVLAQTSFLDDQLLKIGLLLAGEGGLGRYAAAAILSDVNQRELWLGHGYGTYLVHRADLLPMPVEMAYDYPGSLWLELVFELGWVAAVCILLGLSRVVFGQVSWLTVGAVFLLGAIGVKHDVQMLTGFLCAQVIALGLARATQAPGAMPASSWLDRLLGPAGHAPLQHARD